MGKVQSGTANDIGTYKKLLIYSANVRMKKPTIPQMTVILLFCNFYKTKACSVRKIATEETLLLGK